MGIDVEHDVDGVVVVTLDWAERRNALGPDEAGALADAIEGIGDASAVVLRSSSREAFCAGGNLTTISAVVARGEEAIRDVIYGQFQRLTRAIWSCPAVTLAAVNGPAIGAGADLALLCDLLFVGSTGWLAQGWLAVGLIPGMGGAYVVRERYGAGFAWNFATSDSRWNADALQRHGVAIAVEGDAFPAALSRAHAIAARPPAAVRAYKDLVSRTEESFDEHLTSCLNHQVKLLSSGAFREYAAQRRVPVECPPEATAETLPYGGGGRA